MEMLGRRALWEVGLNYGHGTGHGVGNYFGVHECTTLYIFHVFHSLKVLLHTLLQIFIESNKSTENKTASSEMFSQVV